MSPEGVTSSSLVPFPHLRKLLGGGEERVGGRNHSQGRNSHVLSITQVSFKVFCFVSRWDEDMSYG